MKGHLLIFDRKVNDKKIKGTKIGDNYAWKDKIDVFMIFTNFMKCWPTVDFFGLTKNSTFDLLRKRYLSTNEMSGTWKTLKRLFGWKTGLVMIKILESRVLL